MNGLVLDFVRLSVHDGPGIRTTLFLKGCPLNCRWCHNPESISPTPEIGFTRSKCVGCGRCAEACPTGAHTVVGGDHRFGRESCNACGACVLACIPGALTVHGREVSAADAVAAMLEDRTFYAKSGGGCTISGGEPLWQAEFCAEVFARLHEERVHCALDTSGAVPWESFAVVLPHTDLFLYDVKHVDDALHREHTGRPCQDILENLRRLSQCGKPIEVRLPVIPGFNADAASMCAIGEFLERLPNLVGIRLLPYHHARSKYERIGRTDPMSDSPVPDAAALGAAASLLREFGLVAGPAR